MGAAPVGFRRQVRRRASCAASWSSCARTAAHPSPIARSRPSPPQPSGSGGTLTVSATGALPLSYIWFAGESGDTRMPVEGATASALRAPSPGRYWARVANRCGVALSLATAIIADNPPRRRAVRH